jgi:SPP1 gp7 family putative phage head morphogenesis protein
MQAQVQPQDNPQDKPQKQPQDSGQADSESGTTATDAPKKSLTKALTQTQVEAIRQRREGIHDQLEADIQPSVVSFFERQEQRYLDKAATTFATTRSAVRKGILDDLVSGFFDGSETDDHDLAILLYAELQPSLKAGSDEAQLQISFSLDSAAQQKIVDDYLLQNALVHAKGINDTTKSQLTETLRAGIADGEGIPELRARVKSVFTQASTNRATLIARTETAQAFEYANQRAMTESGVVVGKRWLTANDERTENLCRSLEGITVPLDQPFPGGVEPGFIHPGCRCTSIGVVE